MAKLFERSCSKLIKTKSLSIKKIITGLKPGFHTCVSRMHNGARCLTMYGHQWSQAITAFATKACEVATKAYEIATKSDMLKFCEGLQGLCRDMLWLWSIETNNARNKKDCLSSEKKSIAKNKQKNNDNFSESRYFWLNTGCATRFTCLQIQKTSQ